MFSGRKDEATIETLTAVDVLVVRVLLSVFFLCFGLHMSLRLVFSCQGPP